MLERLEILSHFKSEKDFNDYFIANGQTGYGFSFYFLKDNKVVYWSNNQPAVNDSILSAIKSGDFLRLHNGDFLGYSLNVNEKKIIGLILIRNRYEYEN